MRSHGAICISPLPVYQSRLGYDTMKTSNHHTSSWRANDCLTSGIAHTFLRPSGDNAMGALASAPRDNLPTVFKMVC